MKQKERVGEEVREEGRVISRTQQKKHDENLVQYVLVWVDV